jgi:hypothetical protein
MVEATLLDFRFRMRSFKSVMSDAASFQERGITVKTATDSKGRPSSAAKKTLGGAASRPTIVDKDIGLIANDQVVPFVP